eukprot:gene10394-biopygen9268
MEHHLNSPLQVVRARPPCPILVRRHRPRVGVFSSADRETGRRAESARRRGANPIQQQATRPGYLSEGLGLHRQLEKGHVMHPTPLLL